MADFVLRTSSGMVKGYTAVQEGYDSCRSDLISAVRSGQSVNTEYRTIEQIERVSGRLPDDVRSKLGF